MNTLLVVFAAIKILNAPAADFFKVDELVCKSVQLDIQDFLVIQVTCNEVIGAKAAIEYAYSYVQSIGKEDHDTIYAIVAGDGYDKDIEYSTVWSIGFSK